MDIDVADILRPGRKSAPDPGRVVRELEPSDLALLGAERGIQPSVLKKLSQRHHALARALAAGMKDWEAAATTGFDPARISILKSDPMFKELITFYSQNVDAIFTSLLEKLSGLSIDAADELQRRLEDEPEDLSVQQLLGIVEMSADRTGHGPQSSQTHTHLHVDISKRLEAARKRVIEHRGNEIPQAGNSPDRD